MIRVDLHPTLPDKIKFTSDNWLRDQTRIEMLPGSSYSSVTSEWTAPLSWSSCLTLRGIFGDDLHVGNSLAKWAHVENDNRIQPTLRLRQALSIDPNETAKGVDIIRSWSEDEGEESPLYKFQESGVLFLSTAQQAILADDMGTGKTRQTIETLRLLTVQGHNVFPALVICPNGVKKVWEKEFRKWWPDGPSVLMITGGAVGRRRAIAERKDVSIINYEALRFNSRLAPYGSIRLRHCHVCDTALPDTKEWAQHKCERCRKELNEIPWRTIIVDEAHRLKDPKAKQTRATFALATAATEFRFALTGTPIANAPHDMWPALHFVAPREWPSRKEYVNRYCLQSFANGEVIGLKPEMKTEFFKIVDPRIRRMPKEAVLPDLPAKVPILHYVDMSAAQAKAYRQLEHGMIARLPEGLVVTSNPLETLTRLSQFASSCCEITDDGSIVMKAPSNKVDELVSLLSDFTKPAVVFCQHAQLLRLVQARLEKEKISHEIIVGGQGQYDRDRAVDRFQDGYARCIVSTIDAGGEGITLTAADTAVFLQRTWSMVKNNQAEDRIHRIGAEVHESITIIDIISNGTYEERQREVLGDKLELLEEVMRDRQLLARILSADIGPVNLDALGAKE